MEVIWATYWQQERDCLQEEVEKPVKLMCVGGSGRDGTREERMRGIRAGEVK